MDASTNLELQLSEIELLHSMFPSIGEFDIENQSAVEKLREIVESGTEPGDEESIPKPTFSIRITTDREPAQLFCTFPRLYPTMGLPELHVRCSECSRAMLDQLNRDVAQSIAPYKGEQCVLTAVQWLRDNLESYVKSQPDVTESPRKTTAQFQRIWFYMHHIYSKQKRKDIIAWADELKLTGFSMPGKPGVVCVEGESGTVDEFSSRLRALNWKRITIRNQEKEEVKLGADEMNVLRRFNEFCEISFDPHSGKGSRDYHMDLGQFQKYLDERQSVYMFHVLFGVEGK
eukprot:m.6687 g.6687  ORF g.6687 m.6687 type:complete len:288 (+) comp16579_c0_seq1:1-864(+)